MTLNPLTALRLQLFRNGYTPLPVVGPSYPGKSPGKRPGIPEWQSVDIDEVSIREWEKSRQGCVNTGLRCGILRAVDIDILDADLAKALHEHAVAVLGPTPLLRVGKAPKLLLCYRVIEPRPKAETPVYVLPDQSLAQIEVLGFGQQMVAYGTHPDTRAEYTWPVSGPDVVPLFELPILGAAAEATFLTAATAMMIEAHGVEPPREKKEKREKKSERARSHSSKASDNAKPDFGTNFFRNVNSAALQGVDRWVKRLFPAAHWQDNATTPPGAWRVSSSDIGRGLEEDISIHPVEGAQDFGTRQSKTPIDLMIEHGGAPGATEAALTLCEWLGVDPESLGWRRKSDQKSRPSSGRRRSEQPIEDWPEPIDFFALDDLTGAPLLQAKHLPDPIFAFAVDTAARMGVDPSAVALSALVACASVMSDEWNLQPKRFDTDWTEQPRIWGAIVGDPSIRKTPVIKACTTPVDALEAAARERHQHAMLRYSVELNEWKKSKEGEEPKHPVLDRFLVESLTVEALQEVLRDDYKAIQRAPALKVLVRQDEMAEFFANLDRYNAGGKGGGDRGSFLRLYNGGRYTVDRIGRGAFATPNWSACFLGGIQPGPIQRIAKQAEDDGLLQRFMFCVPARQEAGLDQAPNHSVIERYKGLFPALVALHPPRAHDVAEHVRFHADAHVAREAVDQLAIAMSGMPDTSGRLRAAYGKFPGLFARLCLVFHLIDIADLRARRLPTPHLTVLIEATAVRVASYMREVMLPHLLRADALMYQTTTSGHSRWIAGHVLAHGLPRISRRDVMRSYRALRDPDNKKELGEVMDGLVAIGWLRAQPLRGDEREPTAWEVNPAVHTVFAVRAQEERKAREEAQAKMAAAIQAWEQNRRSESAAGA